MWILKVRRGGFLSHGYRKYVVAGDSDTRNGDEDVIKRTLLEFNFEILNEKIKSTFK